MRTSEQLDEINQAFDDIELAAREAQGAETDSHRQICLQDIEDATAQIRSLMRQKTNL